MRIVKQPAAVRRGVTQLMYVGDQYALEIEERPLSTGKKVAIGLGIGILLYLVGR